MIVRTRLWPHQQTALDFALGSTPKAGHAGLWLDMRTGKTLTSLAIMAAVNARRVLVVAPGVPAKEWARQTPLHLDGDYPAPVLLNKGSVRARVTRMREAWLAHRGEIMAIWNYEAVTSAPELLKVDWDLVIYDEGKRVKGPTSKISKYAREKLRRCARRVLNLDGTPLPQGYVDAYGVYTAIADVFPVRNWTHYRNRYAMRGNPRIPQQITGWRNTEELDTVMAQWSVSCRMQDVLDVEIPEDQWVWVELEPKTRTAYEQLEADMLAQVDAGEIVASNALVKALRLQQLAGGCAVVGEGEDARQHVVSSEKMQAVAEIISDLPPAAPVVVFAQFVTELDRLAGVAGKRPLFYIRGGCDQENEFHESAARGEGPVIGVQIQAGSEGIDLSESSHCIFLSTGYSSSRHRQARARIQGSRQKSKPMFWYVGAEGTIDADVAAALEGKRQFEDAVLEKLNVRHIHC